MMTLLVNKYLVYSLPEYAIDNRLFFFASILGLMSLVMITIYRLLLRTLLSLLSDSPFDKFKVLKLFQTIYDNERAMRIVIGVLTILIVVLMYDDVIKVVGEH
jgi:hypothetical protein